MRSFPSLVAVLAFAYPLVGCAETLCETLVRYETQCGALQESRGNETALVNACSKASPDARNDAPAFACAESSRDCATFLSCKRDAAVGPQVDRISRYLNNGQVPHAWFACQKVMALDEPYDGRELCGAVAARYVTALVDEENGIYSLARVCDLPWLRADARSSRACDSSLTKVLEATAGKATDISGLNVVCGGLRHPASKAVCAGVQAKQAELLRTRLKDVRDGKSGAERLVHQCSDLQALTRLDDTAEAATRALCWEARTGDHVRGALDRARDALSKGETTFPVACRTTLTRLNALEASAWVERSMSSVTDACVVKLGAAIMTADAEGCSEGAGHVMTAVATYKVADANLNKLVAEAKARGCKAL